MQPPTAWISNIQESGLSQVAAYYLWRGLAPSTRRNYDTPRSRFSRFCRLAGYQYPNGGCFPAKATWLIEWLCSLARTVKVKTMKLYLAGIKSYQLDLGIECTAFADPRLERTIHGIKRDHQEPERRIRTPLTRPHLILILRHLSRSHYNDIATRAAFTLAFAAFLRVEEFTYKPTDLTLGDAFPKWFLTKSSVRIRGRGAYIELTLPSSKTDPFRKGIKLTIAASLDNACPVRAMEEYLARDTQGPIKHPCSVSVVVNRKHSLENTLFTNYKHSPP